MVNGYQYVKDDILYRCIKSVNEKHAVEVVIFQFDEKLELNLTSLKGESNSQGYSISETRPVLLLNKLENINFSDEHNELISAEILNGSIKLGFIPLVSTSPNMMAKSLTLETIDREGFSRKTGSDYSSIFGESASSLQSLNH